MGVLGMGVGAEEIEFIPDLEMMFMTMESLNILHMQ